MMIPVVVTVGQLTGEDESCPGPAGNETDQGITILTGPDEKVGEF